MAKKKLHGGKRKKAGRKPIEDKKIPVVLYFKQSKIDNIGLEILKKRCYEILNENENEIS
jgi:hypothetical protein